MRELLIAVFVGFRYMHGSASWSTTIPALVRVLASMSSLAISDDHTKSAMNTGAIILASIHLSHGLERIVLRQCSSYCRALFTLYTDV
jgi:hypothetical protein